MKTIALRFALFAFVGLALPRQAAAQQLGNSRPGELIFGSAPMRLEAARIGLHSRIDPFAVAAPEPLSSPRVQGPVAPSSLLQPAPAPSPPPLAEVDDAKQLLAVPASPSPTASRRDP